MEQNTQQSTKGQIYLLMGYLGSGKTTFIRNLLQNKLNKKYAVIQNQFSNGQMGIQQPLIMDQSGVPFSSFLQLPNGCICCSAKNDLIASIQYILSNTDVRNIVVETNGLADPAESIKQFWFDQQMSINGYLHSVISIFSAQRYALLKDQQLFQKQIVFANKVLITFTDKTTQQQINSLQDYILQRNQQCHIQRNDRYDIIQFISGKSLFDINSLNQIEKIHQQHQQHHHQCHQLSCNINKVHKDHEHNQNIQNIQNKNNSHSHKSLHKHLQNKYHNGISSIFIKGQSQLLTKQQIQIKVGQLLWQSGIKVLRIKGVYSLSQQQNVYELQGVDDVFEVKQTKTNKNKYNHQTKILIIIQDNQSKLSQSNQYSFKSSKQSQSKSTQSIQSKSNIQNKLKSLLGIKIQPYQNIQSK